MIFLSWQIYLFFYNFTHIQCILTESSSNSFQPFPHMCPFHLPPLPPLPCFLFLFFLLFSVSSFFSVLLPPSPVSAICMSVDSLPVAEKCLYFTQQLSIADGSSARDWTSWDLPTLPAFHLPHPCWNYWLAWCCGLAQLRWVHESSGHAVPRRHFPVIFLIFSLLQSFRPLFQCPWALWGFIYLYLGLI